MSILKAKTVGLNFRKVKNAVKQGDYVILVAEQNEHDKDAIGVYNSDKELVGFIANSERTLSPNNRKNGNLSATELKGHLDFTNKEYYGEAVRVYSSCIYLEINEGKWSYINKDDDVPELNGIDALKLEIESLKSIVSDLQSQINSLKTLVTVSNEGTTYSINVPINGVVQTIAFKLDEIGTPESVEGEDDVTAYSITIDFDVNQVFTPQGEGFANACVMPKVEILAVEDNKVMYKDEAYPELINNHTIDFRFVSSIKTDDNSLIVKLTF